MFDRRDLGHVDAARRALAASDGMIGYIGEWHTHPEPDPSPSAKDLANWRNLLRQCGHALVFVIVGTRRWHIQTAG